jgi:hypothetical protein
MSQTAAGRRPDPAYSPPGPNASSTHVRRRRAGRARCRVFKLAVAMFAHAEPLALGRLSSHACLLPPGSAPGRRREEAAMAKQMRSACGRRNGEHGSGARKTT